MQGSADGAVPMVGQRRCRFSTPPYEEALSRQRHGREARPCRKPGQAGALIN